MGNVFCILVQAVILPLQLQIVWVSMIRVSTAQAIIALVENATRLLHSGQDIWRSCTNCLVLCIFHISYWAFLRGITLSAYFHKHFICLSALLVFLSLFLKGITCFCSYWALLVFFVVYNILSVINKCHAAFRCAKRNILWGPVGLGMGDSHSWTSRKKRYQLFG